MNKTFAVLLLATGTVTAFVLLKAAGPDVVLGKLENTGGNGIYFNRSTNK